MKPPLLGLIFGFLFLGVSIFFSKEGYLYAQKGYSRTQFNSLKQSLDSLEKALNDATDKEKIAIYNQIAVLFPSIDAEDAVHYAQKALDLAQKHKDLEAIAKSYQSIGKVYEDHSAWDKATINYQKAKQIYQNLNLRSPLAYCLNRIGVCLLRQKKPQQAMENVQESYKIYTSLQDKRGIAFALNNIGFIYQEQKEYAKALPYIQESLNIKTTLKDTTILASTLNNLAYIYLNQKKYEEALRYSLQSYQIAQKLKQTMRAKEASEALAEIYEALKDYSKSAYFLRRQIALEDSLIQEERFRHLLEVQALYEHEKKEIQINNLRAEKEIQGLWILIVVILLALVSIITYFIYRKNIRKERINQVLQQKNAEILNQKNQIESQKKRIEENGKVLIKLVKSKHIQLGDLDRALMQITETTALTLKISRVGIWKYDSELEALFCIDLYEMNTKIHTRGASLSIHKYPDYFEAIKSEKIIQADDAHNHPHTIDFITHHYLEQHQIMSMLDVPFYVDGKLAGVICCEQQQEARHWQVEDVLFVKSICQMITITFKANKRMEAERQIVKQKQTLQEMNDYLQQKNNEIIAQKELLEEKNHEIIQQQQQLHEAYEEQQTLNEELRIMTEHLETIVEERTANLQLANQELDLLTYRISHDFRGPITTMLGLVELVKIEPTQENIQHFVERVSFTANKMDKMLDKMIMIHTINYKNPTANAIIDWTYLEEELHNNLHYLIHPTNTQIYWGIEDELLFWSDVEFLTIILQNLIENAIKFNTQAQPKVWLNATQTETNILLYVKDNGIGILPKYRTAIFDMFFRGSELSNGNGLGLYIVEKAVNKLKGSVSVVDTPSNEGSTFLITIPIASLYDFKG